MTTQVARFEFGARTLRVIPLDGEPWFLAADVCHTLGLSIRAGAMQHLRHLDEQDRRRLDPDRFRVEGMNRGMGKAYVISETGLYRLVMRSDKPIARPFQDWVTREVLPSIRKTGSYSIKGPVPNTSQVVAVRSPALPAAPSPISEALRMIEARTSAILAELVRLKNPAAGKTKGPSVCCA